MKQENIHLEQYIAHFDQFENSLNGQKSSPLHQLRRKAFDRFLDVGFPNRRQEEWRFTNINPLLEAKFQPKFQGSEKKLTAGDIKSFLYDDLSATQLVFIDGYFAPDLSLKDETGDDLIITSFSQITNWQDSDVFSIFMDYETYKEDAFTALNTAFLLDGAVIKVKDNTAIERPIHLLHITTDEHPDQVTYPRNMIFIGKNSQATILESYFSLGSNRYFNNSVTELHVSENGNLNHIRLQNESKAAFHIGNVFVDQKPNSHYFSSSVTFGAAISRVNISTRLDGQACETTLNGLYMGHGNQLIDNHTFIDHANPHCNSYESYQGILTDQAHGVFSGKIMVRPDAQKTDAKQSNNCLLLSDEAQINSKPMLEIYADDVRCTHGATVGQLNEDAIFYLRSRGISEQQAKNLLTYAFAEQVIEGITVKEVREHVDKILLARLSEDINFVK